MSKMCKCRFCKKEIVQSSAYNPQPRMYYCNEEHYELQKNKEKYKPKKTKPNGEVNDRKLLLDYIQELYIEQGYDKHFINWSLITSVLKNIMEEDKSITYGGILYTLWYCKEIERIDLFSDKSHSVLWCVPFNYLNAQIYYNQTVNIAESISNYKEEEVVIHKSNRKRKFHTKLNITQIQDI